MSSSVFVTAFNLYIRPTFINPKNIFMKQLLSAIAFTLLLASCNQQPAATTEAPKEDASAKAIAGYNKFLGHMMAKELDSAYVMMAPDAVDHPAGWPEVHGRDSIMAMIKQWTESCTDMKIEVLHISSDGEHVMAHYRATGNAVPNAMGMPCKGGAFDYTGMEMISLNADGQMTHHWDFPDFNTFATQIGLDMAALAAMAPPAEKK